MQAMNAAQASPAIVTALKVQHHIDCSADLRGKHVGMRLAQRDCRHRGQSHQGVVGRVCMH
ncbi:MAG: hypothetical protein EBW47_06605, partial [Betaproteobacteria bacterium]|nr:hypothetical protein [Betaproteobacteria bacterium]